MAGLGSAAPAHICRRNDLLKNSSGAILSALFDQEQGPEDAQPCTCFHRSGKTGHEGAVFTALDVQDEIGKCNDALIAFVRSHEQAEARAKATAAYREASRNATFAELQAMRDRARRFQENAEYDAAVRLYNEVSKRFVELRVQDALDLANRGRYANAEELLRQAKDRIETYDISRSAQLAADMNGLLTRVETLKTNKSAGLYLLQSSRR